MKPQQDDGPATDIPSAPGETTLPLRAEEVVVSRREAATSVVRVATVTTTHEHPIDEPVTKQRVEVERAEIGRYVDRVPPVREEGDVVVVPVVEEVLVVERRLLLREEVRIRRVPTVERRVETVPLRRQEAVVTRRPAGGAGPEPSSCSPPSDTESRHE